MAGYISDDTRKVTTHRLVEMKQRGEKISMLTAYDYTMAQIVDGAGMDVILVGDSASNVMAGNVTTLPITLDQMIYHAKSVVRGVKRAMVVVDMPFGSYQVSCEQAMTNAIRMIKETGCDCVKLEGGINMADKIAAIVNAGIPVMGHIGLTPQTATSLGGFKVQGGTPESARKLIEDAKTIEKAGVFSIVLECVPSCVARAMSKEVRVPILGIGAGPDVDCQVLVTQDLLGMYGDFKPKFVKQFAQIRKAMVDGLNAFHKETLNGSFPSPEFSFNKQVDIPPARE